MPRPARPPDRARFADDQETFMPGYTYRCGECGPFEVRRPLAEPSDQPCHCPSCGRRARRVFDVPGLRAVAPALRRALDAEARGAEPPAVVAGPGPAARRTPTSTDPRHRRLPRP
jgi:putative FmdB family regulatory protein